jgi:hypothetical protein
MSWGYRITLLFTSFVVFMLFMVYKCTQQNYELVAPDYYAKEIAFETQIQRQKNALTLAEKPNYEITDNQLVLHIPTTVQNGTINFFRPSNSALDFEETIQLDSLQKQELVLSKFKKGLYQMQLNWNDGTKDYYIEEKILIP